MSYLADKTGSPASTPVTERRVAPRYAFTAIAEAVESGSHARISGRLSDIGEDGCYFEVMSPFAAGNIVTLYIFKDDHEFTAKAKVSYSKGGIGMGLAFTDIEPTQQRLLDGWIGELSGELTPDRRVAEIEQEIRDSGSATHQQRNVLNELILMLIQKRVLTDAEGKALLQKLLL
jgi:PilZ domain